MKLAEFLEFTKYLDPSYEILLAYWNKKGLLVYRDISSIEEIEETDLHKYLLIVGE